MTATGMCDPVSTSLGRATRATSSVESDGISRMNRSVTVLAYCRSMSTYSQVTTENTPVIDQQQPGWPAWDSQTIIIDDIK
ncbi:hypothetical protein PoB_005923400 [Plakobranchus ocellatus]|uniref:Uncharacterized protein n=1 Tax=Plakobranchus ocellatus TaxID=259542 RepID=A0AAV4CN35_9GAST|nr:hypothetical protein PoB_005923400 [Plakobranchus ocellatus]